MKIEISFDSKASSRRVRGTLLYIGLPLGVLIGSAALVMADVPNLFKKGDPLSSTKVNANFSSLDTRLKAVEADGALLKADNAVFKGSIPVFTDWQPYTPVLAPSFGTGTFKVLKAYWRREGDSIALRVSALATSQSQGMVIPLPAPYYGDSKKTSHGWVDDNVMGLGIAGFTFAYQATAPQPEQIHPLLVSGGLVACFAPTTFEQGTQIAAECRMPVANWTTTSPSP